MGLVKCALLGLCLATIAGSVHGWFWQSSTVFYEDEGGRMAIVKYTGPKNNVDNCQIYGNDTESMERVKEHLAKSGIKYESKEDISTVRMEEVIDKCFASMGNTFFPFGWMNYVSPETIFPGTRWCGRGNIARDYDQLGSFEETDKCCRTHDHCPDFINRGDTFQNLTNNGAGTMSACHCDEQFRQCLIKSKTAPSEVVAHMFFTMLGMQCFKEDHPIVKCQEYNSPLTASWFGAALPSSWVRATVGRSCKTYEVDTTQPKKYQIFDEATYSLDPSVFAKDALSKIPLIG